MDTHVSPGPSHPVTPTGGSAVSRALRLHAFELLIFAILFVLLALCLAAAPLISDDVAPPVGKPRPEERLVL